MSSIYNGPSEGFVNIAEGYVNYAMEIISGRAIPDMRDGLKPVTRRIIYSAHEHDDNKLHKCVTIVSDALKLHPHGDQAVYGAFALLTDENGSCNVPFFHGMGNLGKVYSSESPAAMRYPKAMINENARDFFQDNEAMELVNSEEGEGLEPKVLPARYPVVLVNGSEGIAVSTGTKMASFNISDVLDLTCKYIKNGDLGVEDTIAPDFPTGGILVANDQELAKIMLTGQGKLKIRARVEIEGKNILVKEVPVGKTVEGIVRTINDNASDIQGLSKAFNSTGRNSKALVTITCKSKNAVEGVLLTLYRKNILQNVFASSILVIEDGVPNIIGVFGIVKKWVSWRKSVLTVKFNKLIEGIQEEKARLNYFLQLVGNEEWKDEYVRRLTKESKKSCHEYLDSIFEGIPLSVKDWIYDRKGSSFNRGGTYKTRYENLLETEESWKATLNDLDSYIVNELQEIKREKEAQGYCKRRTELTYKDYRFSKISDMSEIEDTSYCVYTLRKDGFLTKSRYLSTDRDNVLCEIEATASSVLIGFDNFGRIVRVQGKEIPFTADGEKGVFMAKYFDATFEPEYKVLYLSLLDGHRKMLVYRDGYIGFFDTSEYVGKRNTKIISNGVCLAVRDKLLQIYDEKEIPDYLLLADDSGSHVKLGVVPTSTISVRSRTSRAKVLNGTNINTKYLKGFNNFELAQFISEPDNYVGKLKNFKGDFYGDPSELLDGEYLELCKDL